MDINKRNRSELKSYFITNAIPTESNFADFIDGMLNQKEDGIARPPGSPLCIEAAGDDASRKQVLQLYESFGAAAPEWVLSLRPRSNQNEATSARRGLAVSAADGVSRLFIERDSGKVGIGTIEPAARLHVAGDLRVDGALKVGSIATDAGLTIPAGQPVSGVQVIDFQMLSLVKNNVSGGWANLTGSVTFSQPVDKAVVLLQSWYLRYKEAKEVIQQARVDASCAVDVNNSNTVNVTVGAGLKAMLFQFVDPYNVNVELVVIAVLKRAV